MLTPLLGLMLSAASPGNHDGKACVHPSRSPAMDALAPLDTSRTVTFSATPSFEDSGRAWVVRLSQKGNRGPASVEIVRLVQQGECNRYNIEKSWLATIPEERFNAMVNSVVPFGTPPADQFARHDPMRSLEEVGLDGTGLKLRLGDFGWDITRRLHHSGRTGAAVSSLFYTLVSQHLPAADLPAKDWRSVKGGGRQ